MKDKKNEENEENEEIFSSMNDDEKAAYCNEMDELERVYMAVRQTAETRKRDDNSENIQKILNLMEQSLGALENNPCLKWRFENEFDKAISN